MERLAEAIFDPDEIWVDWREDQNGNLRLVRRYLRWDPQLAAFSLFEWSHAGWSGLTAFDPQAGRPAQAVAHLSGKTPPWGADLSPW